MLYIVNQKNTRIADLHTVSIVTPENDREEDGVYKILINGMDFGRYEKKWEVDSILNEIKEFIRSNTHGLYELPKKG